MFFLLLKSGTGRDERAHLADPELAPECTPAPSLIPACHSSDINRHIRRCRVSHHWADSLSRPGACRFLGLVSGTLVSTVNYSHARGFCFFVQFCYYPCLGRSLGTCVCIGGGWVGGTLGQAYCVQSQGSVLSSIVWYRIAKVSIALSFLNSMTLYHTV